MTKEKEVEHLKCCKHSSSYKPDVIRTHPFKWINFPIFVAIWFGLWWFIVCPIVWSVTHKHYMHSKPNAWPNNWQYYFWSIALLVFCVILGALLLLWRTCVPKSSKYEQIFLNPEYGDEKEILCIQCMTFHPPGGARCPCSTNNKNVCTSCGKTKESFGTCCQKSKIQEERIIQGPTYDVTLRKQQPDMNPMDKIKRRSLDSKRNSMRGIRNSSTSSVIVISPHEMGTKDLITKSIVLNATDSETTKLHPVKSVKSKKPANLQPVDVDLANRHSSVEFLGEKIPLGLTNPEQTTESSSKPNVLQKADSTEQRVGSVGSMESMSKQKFNDYLHLVEINTPFTPEETIVPEDHVAKSPPMSPREIFFYDLIQAAEKNSTGNSPDSTHFGVYNKYEKKRPVSHILLASDVNLEEQPTEKIKKDTSKRHTLSHMKPLEMHSISPNRRVEDLESPRILALTAAINNHVAEMDDEKDTIIVRSDSNDTQRKTTVKILKTVRKSTSTIANPYHFPKVAERNSHYLQRNVSSLSEQNSAHDIDNLKKESVSQFFISDLKAPPKPTRQSSSAEPTRLGSNQSKEEKIDISNDMTQSVTNDNDEVFSD